MGYVYMLYCRGGTLYTGITSDPARRFAEHLSRGKAAAKYTRAHPVTGLAALWETADLSTAARVEYAVKQLSPAKKRALIAAPDELACRLGPDFADLSFRALSDAERAVFTRDLF